MPASRRRKPKPNATQKRRNREKDQRNADRLQIYQTPEGRDFITLTPMTRQQAMDTTAGLLQNEHERKPSQRLDADWRLAMATAMRRYAADGDTDHFAGFEQEIGVVTKQWGRRGIRHVR